MPSSALVRSSMFSSRPRSSWNDGTGGKRGGPSSTRGRDVAVVAVREEVAQPELFELSAAQMRLEAEPLREVVRADLDARLADLEGGLRHRVRPLLDDERAQVRCFQWSWRARHPPASPPPRMTTS